MKKIRLYRNPRCDKCFAYSRMHQRLDWLDHFEDFTDAPPTGPLQVGEIAVQNLASGQILKGIQCFRLLCRHIPVYWLVLPFTYLPPIRRLIEHDSRGCADNACAPPISPQPSHRHPK